MSSRPAPTRTIAVFVATSVLLQWAWEVAHGPAYVQTDLPLFERISHCAPMAVIDAVWSAVVVVAAHVVAVRVLHSNRSTVATISAAFGALTAMAFERWAIDQGRWTYNELMPVLPVVGAGLWPVLQMSILPPVVYLFSIAATRPERP